MMKKSEKIICDWLGIKSMDEVMDLEFKETNPLKEIEIKPIKLFGFYILTEKEYKKIKKLKDENKSLIMQILRW